MSEQIINGKVVSFSYELKNNRGETIEKSDEPMDYLHGNNNIIPGLEKGLHGMEVGQTKTVVVPPGEAYGELDENLKFEVPRANFPSDVQIEKGMQFQTETEDGPLVIVVKDITNDQVIVDGNHPLAGETLHFDVEIVGIREATAQELSHGHVHQHGHDH